MSSPLVSVVITAWNMEAWIGETLDSALAQTHPHVEVIVVDDGSTDSTPAILARYAGRIRTLRQSNQGLAAARNAGIALSRGEYVALLDADDLWTPDKLAVQVAVAARHPDSGLIGCDGVEFEGSTILRESLLNGAALDAVRHAPGAEVEGDFHTRFIRDVPMACPAQTLIPRRVLIAIGPFRNSRVQDYDYYLRVAQRFPVTLHADSLVRWRYREGSMSGRRERRVVLWELDILEVLATHARRCGPEVQFLIRSERARIVRERAWAAYHTDSTTDRPFAVSVLQQLLREQPWPPTALPYLLGVLLPGRLREPARSLFRWTRRLGPARARQAGRTGA